MCVCMYHVFTYICIYIYKYIYIYIIVHLIPSSNDCLVCWQIRKPGTLEPWDRLLVYKAGLLL